MRFNLLYRNTAKYSEKKVELGICHGSVMNSEALGNLFNLCWTISLITMFSIEPRKREREGERERENMSVTTMLVGIRTKMKIQGS